MHACRETRRERGHTLVRRDGASGDYISDFEIKWEVSINGADWVDVGISNNPLYIVHSTPLNTELLFHTVVHLACINAKGLSEPTSIVEAMYNDFMDLSVMRVNTTSSMTYWDPNSPIPVDFCYGLIGLLAGGNGTCGAWANLFDAMIKVQGIEGADIVQVSVKESSIDMDYDQPGHIVNLSNNTLSQEELALLNQDIREKLNMNPNDFDNTGRLLFVKNWMITDPVSTFKVSDTNGIAGQGNIPNPRSRFPDHAILKYTDKQNKIIYFDPAYGKKYNNEEEWELGSIAGVGTSIRHKVTNESYNWFRKLNTNEREIDFEIP